MDSIRKSPLFGLMRVEPSELTERCPVLRTEPTAENTTKLRAERADLVALISMFWEAVKLEERAESKARLFLAERDRESEEEVPFEEKRTVFRDWMIVSLPEEELMVSRATILRLEFSVSILRLEDPLLSFPMEAMSMKRKMKKENEWKMQMGLLREIQRGDQLMGMEFTTGSRGESLRVGALQEEQEEMGVDPQS